jgi:hypothetical protein
MYPASSCLSENDFITHHFRLEWDGIAEDVISVRRCSYRALNAVRFLSYWDWSTRPITRAMLYYHR